MITPHITRRALFGTLGAASAAAAIGGLSGCSSSNAPDGGSGGANGYKPGSASLKVQLGKEIPGVKYPDGYIGPVAREIEKFGDGNTEIRILVRQEAGLDYPKNKFTQWLEKTTGVKVKFDVVPMGADGATKINAMIASGDVPDAFLAGPVWMGGFTRSQLYAYGQQGLFLPLDKLIDEYAPNALENFNLVPGLREQYTAPNGVMYALPSLNQCYHCRSSNSRMWISKTWMKKLGVTKQPETLDDLEALMGEMKGFGIPVSGTKTLFPIAPWLNAYLNTGTNWSSDTNWLLRKDGKVTHAVTLPKLRDAVIRISEQVNRGLIDKNSFTQTEDQMKRLTMAKGESKVGIVSGLSQGAFDNINYDDPNGRWLDFEVLRPVTGPDGKAYVPWDYTLGGAVGMVITNKAKDPQTVIQWGDAQLSLLGTLSMKWGVRGEGWDWATTEKGIDGRQAIYKHLDTKTKNQSWVEEGPYTLMRDVRHAEAINPAKSVEPALYDAGKLYETFASPKEEYFSTPFFNEEQANQIAEVQANVTSATNEGLVAFFTGSRDPSNQGDWDAFQQALKSAGLDTYLKVLTEADAATSK